MIMWPGGQGSGRKTLNISFQKNPMIGKTITIKDYKGVEVTRKVLGIDPRPTICIVSATKLKGEHFVLADENGSFTNRTYARTDQPYKVVPDAESSGPNKEVPRK